MTTQTTERIFSTGDLPRLSLPDADGLITCRWFREPVILRVAAEDGGDVLGERRRAQVGFTLVEPTWMVRASAERVRAPEVDAVVLHVRSSSPGRSALALAFTSHLRRLRHRADMDANVVTAGARPELTGQPDLVRIPHLVTVTDVTGAVADAVVWEIMTQRQYDAWLDGATRPDQKVIEAHLPRLLRLRGLHRAGRLTHRHAGALLDLLDGGVLSIRLVYRHTRVVLAAATQGEMA
jgi:hypothetical protein